MTTQHRLVPTAHPASLQPEADPREIHCVFASQQETALLWRASTAAERIARIKRLRDAMMAQREAFYAAFAQDFGKSPSEVEITELLPVMEEVRQALGALKRWMKPRRVWPTTTMLGTRAKVQYQPRGRVLIIAPWNYPLCLCFGPLVSALAAGNTVIIKPSEMTPAVSALMARIVREVFPSKQLECDRPSGLSF
jgi:aldehyde dehydrogenase (NAD+)